MLPTFNLSFLKSEITSPYFIPSSDDYILQIMSDQCLYNNIVFTKYSYRY